MIGWYLENCYLKSDNIVLDKICAHVFNSKACND